LEVQPQHGAKMLGHTATQDSLTFRWGRLDRAVGQGATRSGPFSPTIKASIILRPHMPRMSATRKTASAVDHRRRQEASIGKRLQRMYDAMAERQRKLDDLERGRL
jgi:hypothetical protein